MPLPVRDHDEPPLVIRLFGPFDARLHGQPLPRLRSRKGQWLLSLLALRSDAVVERKWLAGLLWPDSPEPQALGNLRLSLADLRQALGPEAGRLHSPTPRTLTLLLTGGEVDVVTFDAAVARGDLASLEAAVALYRGPLLEGCAEEWAFQERQTREQACLAALERLAEGAREHGGRDAGERYLRQAVTLDPSRETAQRALMRLLATSGNYAAAIQAYRDLRAYLHRELNAQPDAETTALFEHLRAEARQKAALGAGRWALGKAEEQLTRETGSPRSFTQRPAPSAQRRVPARAERGEGAGATHTFLFTDVEGSTKLWEEQPEAMRLALAQHDELLREAIETHGGRLFKTIGDAFCAAFAAPADALRAALAIQRALPDCGMRVRMALHTGAAEAREGDYFGLTLNRVARMLEAGHGGQILLSSPTQELVLDDLPPDSALTDLGSHRLRDLRRAERLYQVRHPALPEEFPPLRSLNAQQHNLPHAVTRFIGRMREIEEVKRLLAETRLLTVTGPGGTGKTRLAIEVAADLCSQHPDGVWLVELAPLGDPALVPEVAAQVLGIREQPGRPLTETLVGALQSRQLLVVLDNCEHLLAASAALADALLLGCPGVRFLATSREGLNIPGETLYRLPTLPLPELQRGARRAAEADHVAALTRNEAVLLFIDRATASVPSFAVTGQNAHSVAQLCRHLDGIPLAIELAAARVKALPVEQLCRRLDDRFRVLTGGSRTAAPRQQTLRALVDWSYDLLTEPERALLRRLSVFAGGWTMEAAEAVCADTEEVLDLLSSLVEKSLVQYEARGGEARYRTRQPAGGAGLVSARPGGRGAGAATDRGAGAFLAVAGSHPRSPGALPRRPVAGGGVGKDGSPRRSALSCLDLFHLIGRRGDGADARGREPRDLSGVERQAEHGQGAL